MKTNQVTGDDKIARITDLETYALTAIGADAALKEFLGPRSDNQLKKEQLYQNIANEGYCRLDTLEGDLTKSQTINTIDIIFLGAGIKTDLISEELMLSTTGRDKIKNVEKNKPKQTKIAT